MVKWFDVTKGYGFIEQRDGNGDTFVHESAVERAGLKTLSQGEKVTFDIKKAGTKTSAVNLHITRP